MTNQPTFFDIDPEHSAVPRAAVEGESFADLSAPSLPVNVVNLTGRGTAGVDAAERTTWNEVPQTLFESWPTAMQVAYCASRDDNAAVTTDDAWLAVFYRERAEAYRCVEVTEQIKGSEK